MTPENHKSIHQVTKAQLIAILGQITQSKIIDGIGWNILGDTDTESNTIYDIMQACTDYCLSESFRVPELQTIEIKKMTLAQKIKANPYLKVSNCTDINDLERAMDDLRMLDKVYGADNQTLLKIWAQMLAKKKELQNQ